MTNIKFYNKADESKLTFAVIITRCGAKWLLCKHKKRTTYEFPGGHREAGESIEQTAKRELQEETGVVEYSLKRICDYSVRGTTSAREELGEEVFGSLF